MAKRGRPPKLIVDAAREQRRLLAESSLEEFINLVHPKRHLGSIHREIISWWTGSDAKSHQLLLLPRDHMKSALIAYRVAWELTKNPSLRFLYISSTINLATKQLKFIKDLLTSDIYRAHWPDMVLKEESKREQWTAKEISVDHPKRKEEMIRDPSIFTAGLTSNIVGLHSDVNVLDDIVVANNAYTQETRDKVEDQYGYLSAIGGAKGRVWIVGTRYHPEDLYGQLLARTVKQYDGMGTLVRSEKLYDHREWPVENIGDGTGEFIWPRSKRADGEWFGFDAEILANKKTEYKNQTYFRAQYYNDPHDVDSSPIKREYFQYYDPKWLVKTNYKWVFQREPLNVFAAVDFAFTTGKASDYTAIVVIGVDGHKNYYVLDIDRFKTGQPSDYYKHILKLHEKWGFRQIRAEVSVAQIVLINDFKENYIRKYGLSLTVDEHRPTRADGAKEERIMSVLEPRYANRQIWHYSGGHCQTLEEELIYVNSAHDDIKDALASAIDFSAGKAPVNYTRIQKENSNAYTFNARFGGVA